MSIYTRLRSPFYWTKFYRRFGPRKGEMVRLSTGVHVLPESDPGHRDALRAAKQRAAEIRATEDAADLAQGPAPAAGGHGHARPASSAAPPVVPLKDLKDADLTRARAKGVSDKQITSLTEQWDNHILRVLGHDFNALTITYEVLLDYIGRRRGEPGAGGAKTRGQSIRRERQAILRGLAALKRRGLLAQLPEAPEIKNDPAHKAQAGKLHPYPILTAWLAELRRMEESGDPRGRGALVQAEVALFCGLRDEEMARLTVEWLEPASEAVQTETGCAWMIRLPEEGTKGRRERLVGIPEAVARDVTRLWRPGMSYQRPLIGCDHRRAWRRAATAIGYFRTITPRDLRHCFGTIATHGTGDIRATQAAMGHTDLRSTERYLSATEVRTAQATVAVHEVLAQHGLCLPPTPDRHTDRHIEVGTPDVVEDENQGCIGDRGEWIRTTGFLLPKHLETLQRHLSLCFSCRQVVADRINAAPLGAAGDGPQAHTGTPDGQPAALRLIRRTG